MNLGFVSAIPNPAPIYCKNMGYTENTTSCIFSDGNSCELWAFYNGECGQQYVKNLTCVEKGGSLSPGYKCCEGLSSITPSTATRILNGVCDYAAGSFGICAPCGNGVCDKDYENKCNCPEDCSDDTTNCSKNGEKVFGTENFGPIKCCSKNAGIRPNSALAGNMCIALADGSKGTCIDNWWKTCGDGVCDSKLENKCNCPKDCSSEKPFCGNGICDNVICYGTNCPPQPENHNNCPQDCCKTDSDCPESCLTCGIGVPCPPSPCIKYKCYDGTCKKPINECKIDLDCPSACSMCGNPDNVNYEECMKRCVINKCINGMCKTTNNCQPTKCDDGTMTECKESSQSGICSCSSCPHIIIKPVCGNGICESGEGEICVASAIASICEEGKECKMPPSTCYVACPQDCKTSEPIYANLNEKFKLEVYQSAKIRENNNDVLKITFKDLIAYKCKEAEISSSESQIIREKVASVTGGIISETTTSSGSSPGGVGVGGGSSTQPSVRGGGGGGISVLKCIGAGPKALLRVETIVNGELGKNNIINLDVGEKKQVEDFTIYFSGYDYASRTGIFLVARETFSCPVGCKCDNNGEKIICLNKTCGEKETLCPDGTCKDKCEINSEDCKYGCMYEGKCFPMGVRSNGNYCSDNLVMSSQLKSNEKCENNFECNSNVCVGGKCINQGLIEKIMKWFQALFGA